MVRPGTEKKEGTNTMDTNEPKGASLRNKVAILFILLFPSLVYVFLASGRHNFARLPYYGPRHAVKLLVDGKEKTDTIYHQVPPFRFFNQLGKPLSEKNMSGKIYVSDFFFASCRGICPKMTSQLHRVQKKFAKREQDDVRILSHTVDPKRDSAEALEAYAERNNADPRIWNFVTGDKKELYGIARNGYLLPVQQGDGGPDDFIHSEQVVLVDKDRHIRGFYDGTDSLSVSKLLDDMDELLAEYEMKEPSQKNKVEYRPRGSGKNDSIKKK